MSQSQFDVNVTEGRSLPNVLKRLSNLIALRNVVCILRDTLHSGFDLMLKVFFKFVFSF